MSLLNTFLFLPQDIVDRVNTFIECPDSDLDNVSELRNSWEALHFSLERGLTMSFDTTRLLLIESDEIYRCLGEVMFVLSRVEPLG